MSTVFKAKVLESHTQRVYGSTVDSDSYCSGSDTDSSTELLGHPSAAVSTEHTLKENEDSKTSDGASIHKQHEVFMQRQIRQANSYKESREKLPRTISSKRMSGGDDHERNSEDPRLNKKVKLSSEVPGAAVEQKSQKGPRTVSKAEKNRRRKLKKKKRLAQDSQC